MFNPISWGISFFSFWLLLWTTGNPSYWVKGLAWFSLVLSVILLVSIFCGWLRELLRKPIAVRVVLPIVFTVSILAFGIGWMVSLPLLTGAVFHISGWLGLIWVIAYLVVLVANVDRGIGITISAALIIAGIVNLSLSLVIQGAALSVLGLLLLLAAFDRIPLRGKVPIF